MSDSDIMMLSIFFNIILLFNNYVMYRQHKSTYLLLTKSFRLAEAIADGRASVQRDAKGFIHIKEIKNETN